jgi:hypothetical protein
MDTFAVGTGVSTLKEYRLAAKEAVTLALAGLKNQKPSLAFVVTTVEHSHPYALEAIAALLGNTVLVGASSAAIMTERGVFAHGIAIMLLSFPDGCGFSSASISSIYQRGSLAAGEALGEKLSVHFGNLRRDLCVLFSDGLISEGTNLLQGLQNKLGLSFPIVGGSAADDLRFAKTFTYHNKEALSDAASAVLLGGKIYFGIGTKHGLKPLGKPRIVTSSTGSSVFEIDHAPARALYEEYFAADLAALRKEIRRISVRYPIGINLAGEQEYLLRNIHSILDNGTLVFRAEVPQESTIRLMIGTKEKALAAAKEAAIEALHALGGGRAQFVLVFSSISRYMLLGKSAEQEIAIIKEIFGAHTPILGLYTFGEHAPLNGLDYRGKTYCHNQTISILAASTSAPLHLTAP